MAAKKSKRAGAKKSLGPKKSGKKSAVSGKGVLNQAKKAVGNVLVAAAKGAATGALQGAVEEGSKVAPVKKAAKAVSNAGKKTSKATTKKTSKKK